MLLQTYIYNYLNPGIIVAAAPFTVIVVPVHDMYVSEGVVAPFVQSYIAFILTPIPWHYETVAVVTVVEFEVPIVTSSIGSSTI